MTNHTNTHPCQWSFSQTTRVSPWESKWMAQPWVTCSSSSLCSQRIPWTLNLPLQWYAHPLTWTPWCLRRSSLHSNNSCQLIVGQCVYEFFISWSTTDIKLQSAWSKWTHNPWIYQGITYRQHPCSSQKPEPLHLRAKRLHSLVYFHIHPPTLFASVFSPHNCGGSLYPC